MARMTPPGPHGILWPRCRLTDPARLNARDPDPADNRVPAYTADQPTLKKGVIQLDRLALGNVRGRFAG